MLLSVIHLPGAFPPALLISPYPSPQFTLFHFLSLPSSAALALLFLLSRHCADEGLHITKQERWQVKG